MPALPNFVTVPQELQGAAHACYAHLKQNQLSPKCEHSELHFPETALLYSKVSGEQRFYLVDARLKEPRVDLWFTFGRSCTSATYIVFCLPASARPSLAALGRLRTIGIGLLIFEADGTLTTLTDPIDLSVNVTLPPLSSMTKKLQPSVGAIHATFARDWKKGFEDACKLTENTARKYLSRQVEKASPIQVQRGSKTKTLTLKEVKKMTLGQLADAFCQLLYPKLVDSLLCSGLKQINPDRINAAHGLLKGAKEKKLRGNIAKHMWTIHTLLKSVPK